MKKLLSTITTFALVLMIPALFIGYLYNSNLADNSQPVKDAAKTETANNSEVVTFKPGLMFILQ